MRNYSTAGEVPSGRENSSRPEGEEATSKPSKNKGWSFLKELVIIIVIAILLSFLLKTFLFRAYFIPSLSMADTLQIDDRVFVNLLVPQPFSLQRGDIVVFKDSQGWLGPEKSQDNTNLVQKGLTFVGLLPDQSQQYLIKRVIGLPGDTVKCCTPDSKISINGAVIDEPYQRRGSDNTVGGSYEVTVPPGRVWVLGDNRNNSADSRAHTGGPGQGFVPYEDIQGTAVVIAWPIDRWRTLSNYSEIFSSVPSP